MSTPDPQSGSRAAELAAQQVEQIVAAAQAAAEQIRADAERKMEERRASMEAELAEKQASIEGELAKIRGDAEAEAQEVLRRARDESAKARERAQAEAIKLGEDSRKEATERVAEAEKAADEALADARAISGGLRRLGQSLEDYAERILRDVQAGHRRLRGDLRIASGSPATPGERARRSEPSTRGTPSSGRGSPFEEIDVPEWVAPEE